MFKIFLLFSFSILLVPQESQTIQVNISNLDNDQGQVIVKLYNSKESFLKKTHQIKKASIKSRKATITFQGVSKGQYAIAIIHDENANDKIDFNFFGIPAEPLGSSNNAKGFMGPPSWKDAQFEVGEEGAVQNIRF